MPFALGRRGEVLSRRRNRLKVWIVHNDWIPSDLWCLDHRLAFCTALTLGLVIVITIVALSIPIVITSRAVEPAPDRPMPFQGAPRSRRDLRNTLGETSAAAPRQLRGW